MRASYGAALAASLIAVTALLATAAPTPAAAAARPDIRTVTVDRDRLGTLHFVIAFAAPVVLDEETKLQVMLDTDRNSGTGIQGSEYALDYSELSPTLLTAEDGETLPYVRSSLRFATTRLSATFSVSARDVGDPASFDFWVFVDQGGKLVDNAPTHVLLTPDAAPWTYPKGDVPTAANAYPVETYTDASDTSLATTHIPWVLIVLGVLAIGAALGIGGWAYDKLRKKPPPQRPLEA